MKINYDINNASFIFLSLLNIIKNLPKKIFFLSVIEQLYTVWENEKCCGNNYFPKLSQIKCFYK